MLGVLRSFRGSYKVSMQGNVCGSVKQKVVQHSVVHGGAHQAESSKAHQSLEAYARARRRCGPEATGLPQSSPKEFGFSCPMRWVGSCSPARFRRHVDASLHVFENGDHTRNSAQARLHCCCPRSANPQDQHPRPKFPNDKVSTLNPKPKKPCKLFTPQTLDPKP